MTAAPGSRIPLVLAEGLLSSFLDASSQQRGDDDNGLHLDFLHPAAHYT